MQANCENGKSRFYTRSGLDWLNRFSFINPSIEKLPPNSIIAR
jgi:ATP-dependent DNA ligase